MIKFLATKYVDYATKAVLFVENKEFGVGLIEDFGMNPYRIQMYDNQLDARDRYDQMQELN